MGNICPCPKRKQNTKQTYDVHEETFEIEENISSPEIKNVNNNQFEILNEEINSGKENREKETQSEAGSNISLTSIKRKKQQQSQNQSIKKAENNVEETRNNNLNSQVVIPLGKQQPKKKQYSFQKKQVNIEDYRFINLNNEFRVKKIDSIKQQQFNIDSCTNCTFFIFDITANLYVDNCQDCFIFCAPCQSTIFIRDSKRINMISASKQFRTRDCFDSKFSIYCNSQPVIESSNNLSFSNYGKIGYPEFHEQLNKIRMEIFNNHWSQIHDFTKKQNEKHFSLMLEPNFIIDQQKGYEQGGLKYCQPIIPLTFGELQTQTHQQIIVIFGKKVSNNQLQLLSFLIAENIIISRSFKGKLTSYVISLANQYFEEQIKASQQYLCIKIINTNDISYIQKFNKYKTDSDGQYIGEEQQFVVLDNKQIVQRISSEIFVNFKDEH